MNYKTLLQIIFFLCLLGIQFSSAQVLSSNKKINFISDSTSIKSSSTKTIKFLKRNSSSKEVYRTILPSEIPVISESGEKALIVDEGKSLNGKGKARVYNSFGDVEREFEVQTTAYYDISKEGKLVFYGGIPEESSDGSWSKAHLFFYDSKGLKIKGPDRTFGINTYAKFSESGQYLVFMADSVASDRDPKVVELYVFDRKFNIIGHHSFYDWPLFSFFEEIIINETSKKLTIHNHFGNYKNLTKQTIIVDFNGLIKERKEGW